MKGAARAVLVLIALLGLSACGSEEVSTTSDAAAPARDAGDGLRALGTNQRPVIESLQLNPMRPRSGERITARVAATDPDGDTLRIDYRWRINGKAIEDAGRTLHLEDAPKGALVELIVVASDEIDQSEPVRATVRVGNLPPRVLQVVIEPLGAVSADHDITASPRATDPDGDDMEFSYTWLVDGRAVDVDGPTLSSEHYQRGDTIVLEVEASDGVDESEPLRSGAIEVANSPPRIVSTPGQLSDDGIFRYDIKVEDVDGDRSFVYRIVSGPAGLTVDPVDGHVSWSPSADQAGTHPVKLEVDDRHGGIASQTFEMQISNDYDESTPAAPPP